MINLSVENKIEFFKFINGDNTISDLEKFIFSRIELEHQIDSETYLTLISLNFEENFDYAKLLTLVKNKIIEAGEFESWKLKKILTEFLIQPHKIDVNLDKIYHLYYGIYQENTERKYEFKFLGNLALNYLFWAEEGYLKTHYGHNWKSEYKKCAMNFDFYFEQLKDFASEILIALDKKEIEILNDGNYKITDDLKKRLETDEIYTLKHLK